MGMKGKAAKEKLKKYMLFANNENIKKDFIQKYYRYAKLRYGIEDYFKLLQVHQQKLIVFAESDLKKAKFHQDTIACYTRRLEQWLDEVETLHKAIGFVDKKK